MILRCTARLLALLGGRDVALADVPPADDDWFANLLWIERRNCLLISHAGTLFPVFAADVRKAHLTVLRSYVAGLVVDALASEGLPADTLGRLDPGEVHVARTASRSVLGHMNEMAFMC